jgi:hypothetical protein
MKKILILLISILPLLLQAQDIVIPDSVSADTLTVDSVFIATENQDTITRDSLILLTEAMPHVIVHQDSLIRQLLYDKVSGTEKEEVEVDGFRVQIYSSNNQQMAKLEAIRLEKDMRDKLDVPIYVTYTPPFWKVRVGNFATYEDAIDFKNGFVREFPELTGDTYVVRDLVTLKR